jgi:hypothetical protein
MARGEIKMGYVRLPIIGGGGGGGTSDDVSNTSDIPGATVTDALNNADADITNIVNLQTTTQYVPEPTITITATDITNKYVVLTNAPETKALTQVFIIGGTIQTYGEDFIVTADDSGKCLSWSGLGLETHIAENDMIVVIHN